MTNQELIEVRRELVQLREKLNRLERKVTSQIDDAEIVARQKAAFKELWRKLDAIPDTSPQDGLSGVDHDRIIYGNEL